MPADMVPDESLLPALLAGDLRHHFPRLVEVYQDRLVGFATRLTGNAQDAQDIVQDAFVRTYVACLAYSPDRLRTLRLRPWLYKITLNEFRHATRGSHLSVISLSYSEHEERASPFPATERDDACQRPDLIVEARERRAELEAALALLPERHRVPLICAYFEEMTYAEIADLLDQPVGTVKSAIFRGVRTLRKLLADTSRSLHTPPDNEEGSSWTPKTKTSNGK